MAQSFVVRLKVTRGYKDTILERQIEVGEILEVSKDRALMILRAGFAELLEITKLNNAEDDTNPSNTI